MCSDHDAGASAQGIGAAIRVGVLHYELGPDDVKATVEALFDLASARARELGVCLIVALLGLEDSDADLGLVVDSGLARAGDFDDMRVRTAVANKRMCRTLDTLEGAVSSLNQRYEKPNVTEILRSVA